MRRFFVLLVPVLHLAGQGFPASYSISTAAGSDWVGDQGPAANAILRQAEGLTSDLSANLYIADAVGHRIRVVSAAGVIRTEAGTGIPGFSGDGGPAFEAQLDSPYGILLDPRGNLIVADLGNSRVRRITPDGTITTIAGGGSFPAGGVNEGSLATSVALNAPRNLAMDSAGNLYISDFGAHRVYRLDRGGSLTTVAGTGIPGFGGDGGAAYSAQLAYPAALAVDRQDNLYIADTQNHLIRKVSRGLITSYARAATPTGLAVDGLGTLYIADASGGQIVEIPVAGKASALPLSALDLALSTDGSLYVSKGTLVLRLSPQGAVTLAAGGGDTAHGDQADAKLALLNHPAGTAVDQAGNLYIADRDNNRIRRVSPAGIITTVAGTGTPGNTGDGLPATLATLNAPSAMSVDSTGVVYITDTGNHRIRKIALDGTMFAVLGTGLQSPVYTVPGPLGDLYIADTGLSAILHWSGGILTTVKSGLQGPRGLALDPQGNLYFTEMDAASVSRLSPDGTVIRLAPGFWNIPRGVAVTSSGAVLVADTGLQQILQLDSSAHASVVAGTGSPGFSGDGGAAPAAQLGFPWDITAAAGGVLYFADLDNNRIRTLTPAPQATLAQVSLYDIVNAATLLPGPIAPGMLVAIRGTGLGAAQLSTTQVLFGSIAGTILSVNDTQLLVQVPPQLSTGAVNIDVQSSGSSLGVVQSVAVVDAAPALFADSTGQAAANNEDGTLNSASNPAARGSIIALYGTGLGVTGQSVTIQISGISADVLYAGPVAGEPGLFQVNARVPAGFVAPGIVSALVKVGQASGQGGVTVAIK
jgi:uncharacterized protein (TIGR03437 family)